MAGLQATAQRTSAETLRTHGVDDRVSGSFPVDTAVSSASALHRAHYDRHYRVPNAFKVRPWLFSPLIRTLVRRAAPPKGTVIDVGCGQGQFTDLLAEAAELPVTGVDVSPQAITSAIDTYPHCGFAVMDALALPSCTYAMIFARSLSLYNTSGFASDRTVTNRLVTALQPGGVLIWLYNVTPGRAPSGWRHHSLRDVRAHFAAYGTAQVAFSLRLDAWLPSRVFWSPLWTRIAYRLARLFRRGGELIVILTAPDSPRGEGRGRGPGGAGATRRGRPRSSWGARLMLVHSRISSAAASGSRDARSAARPSRPTDTPSCA
jgi:SAM-dependent methyltransferase